MPHRSPDRSDSDRPARPDPAPPSDLTHLEVHRAGIGLAPSGPAQEGAAIYVDGVPGLSTPLRSCTCGKGRSTTCDHVKDLSRAVLAFREVYGDRPWGEVFEGTAWYRLARLLDEDAPRPRERVRVEWLEVAGSGASGVRFRAERAGAAAGGAETAGEARRRAGPLAGRRRQPLPAARAAGQGAGRPRGHLRPGRGARAAGHVPVEQAGAPARQGGHEDPAADPGGGVLVPLRLPRRARARAGRDPLPPGRRPAHRPVRPGVSVGRRRVGRARERHGADPAGGRAGGRRGRDHPAPGVGPAGADAARRAVPGAGGPAHPADPAQDHLPRLAGDRDRERRGRPRQGRRAAGDPGAPARRGGALARAGGGGEVPLRPADLSRGPGGAGRARAHRQGAQVQGAAAPAARLEPGAVVPRRAPGRSGRGGGGVRRPARGAAGVPPGRRGVGARDRGGRGGRPRGSRPGRGPELVLARDPLRLRRLDRLPGPRARRAQPGGAVSGDVRGLDRPARSRPAPPGPVARALPGRRRRRTAARRAAAPFGCRAARPPGGDRAGDPGGRGEGGGRGGRRSARSWFDGWSSSVRRSRTPIRRGSRPRSAPTRSGGWSG